MKYRSVFNVNGPSVNQQKSGNSELRLPPAYLQILVKLIQQVLELSFVHLSSPFVHCLQSVQFLSREPTSLCKQRAICKQVSVLSKKTNFCTFFLLFQHIGRAAISLGSPPQPHCAPIHGLVSRNTQQASININRCSFFLMEPTSHQM